MFLGLLTETHRANRILKAVHKGHRPTASAREATRAVFRNSAGRGANTLHTPIALAVRISGATRC